jgi:uncharacterized protein
MSATIDRVRMLRTQAGRVAPNQHSEDDNAQATIAQLRRLLRTRAPSLSVEAVSQTRDLPGVEIAPGLRFLETWMPVDPVPEHFSGAFDRRVDFASRDVLCFDTETTGLAGGTGTRAFMIGAANWQDSKIRVRQLLMTSLSAEAAMLDTFASWLKPEHVLVSYNGKCYDATLLATRYRLAKKTNPLTGMAHVDLLFPVRRQYRGRWENCRLATIERRVLGIVREDDLPGSEAPAAWLTYLRGGASRNLIRVIEHNKQDVVSLSMLLACLGCPTE